MSRALTNITPTHCVSAVTPSCSQLQWLMSESIFNWIPKPVERTEKEPLYKSKHDPRCPPTASTFVLNNTTRIPGTNVGSNEGPQRGILEKRSGDLYGTAVGKADPRRFLRKGTGTAAKEVDTKSHRALPRSFVAIPLPSITFFAHPRLCLSSVEITSTRPCAVLPSAAPFRRASETRRPSLPGRSERPIMGLKSDVDFVTQNAVENILARA